jgi:hypothetical protein
MKSQDVAPSSSRNVPSKEPKVSSAKHSRLSAPQAQMVLPRELSDTSLK